MYFSGNPTMTAFSYVLHSIRDLTLLQRSNTWLSAFYHSSASVVPHTFDNKWLDTPSMDSASASWCCRNQRHLSTWPVDNSSNVLSSFVLSGDLRGPGPRSFAAPFALTPNPHCLNRLSLTVQQPRNPPLASLLLFSYIMSMLLGDASGA